MQRSAGEDLDSPRAIFHPPADPALRRPGVVPMGRGQCDEQGGPMARMLPTKGQLEAEISDAVTQFEKEHMGRGPLETRTYIVDDMVIVRLKGILTKAEHQLVKSSKETRGRDLIKQVRKELIESGRPVLESAVRHIVHSKVRSLHADISTVTGEKIIVFTLDRRPEYA
jgi:uncharacterized protein YbcI